MFFLSIFRKENCRLLFFFVVVVNFIHFKIIWRLFFSFSINSLRFCCCFLWFAFDFDRNSVYICILYILYYIYTLHSKKINIICLTCLISVMLVLFVTPYTRTRYREIKWMRIFKHFALSNLWLGIGCCV